MNKRDKLITSLDTKQLKIRKEIISENKMDKKKFKTQRNKDYVKIK